MIDNQPVSPIPEPETPATNQAGISNQTAPESSALDFARLTSQNWLFINCFISSRDVRKAYKMAKYSGTDESAPYQIFKKLKPYIEQIGDLDVTSRARLQADLKSLLDIPLEEKKTLTVKEFLEVRKFMAKVTPEAIGTRPQLSVLVINRAVKSEREQGESGKGTTNQRDSQQIIDVTPIEEPKP